MILYMFVQKGNARCGRMYTIHAQQLHHYISMCWRNEIANLELLQDNDLSL
jgi:hypothetical protein